MWPLWRIRNLDVAVAASTALSIVLFNHWMLDRMVYVSYAAMAYLAIRCAWRALGPQRAERPATPIYEQLTRSWSATQQVRLLRLLALSCALVVAMVGLSSLSVIDVGYAVMEGATAIVHGLLPYGHVGDILHGDTYPIASYLLYTPFALFLPVHTVFDDADPVVVGGGGRSARSRRGGSLGSRPIALAGRWRARNALPSSSACGPRSHG